MTASGQDLVCVGCGTMVRVALHYSAPSCFGCKSFFRRTIIDRRRYLCISDGNCDVESVRESGCRACRFKRCLLGGMNEKHIREERWKKKRKAEAQKNDSEGDRDAGEHTITVHLTGLEKAVEEQIGTKEPNEFRLRMLDEFGIPKGEAANEKIKKKMIYECSRVMDDATLVDSFHKIAHYQSEWAGGLTILQQFSPADQMVLFRHNFLALTWLHFSYRTYLTRQEKIGIPLGNGSCIPYLAEAKEYLHVKWSTTYAVLAAKLIHTIVRPMIEMQLDFEEYVLLKALTLFIPDSQLSPAGIQKASDVRDTLGIALFTHIEKRFLPYAPMKISQRCSRINLLLPPLVSASHFEANFVQQISNIGQPSQSTAATPESSSTPTLSPLSFLNPPPPPR